ncbi:MAG TPA: TonB-dependent receptor [Thermodesulfovibrio thiophilus]|nr:TonB-dependent receptor [Thermodesulfovibrio thiophilus]
MIYLIVFIVVFLCFDPAPAGQQNDTKLPEVVVTGEKIMTPTKQTGETVYTGTELTTKGLELSGERGKTNIYEAISILPGVVFESPDSNNLATEQTNIRVRGIRGYLGAMTVEGIPNYGGNPMGPRAYIYDLENFESISLYKGAVPGDLGVGVGNRGGAIELRPLWADEKFGLKLSQSVGSFEYKRTFLRLDSGTIGSVQTRLSLSYSFTEQDKWKGPGDIGPRNNFNFTFVQPVGETIEIKLWANFNEIKHYKYRSLSYKEIKDLDNFYRLDFNKSFTGTPADDYFYYKYNWERHKNRDFYGFINVKVSDSIKLIFKPYISKEDAKIKDGLESIQGKPGVQERIRDIERKGLISEIAFEPGNIKASLGYHYESADMNIYTENYWINNEANLTYRGYGVLTTTETNYINSPYLKIAGTIEKINWQMGIKYFKFKDSESKGYVTEYPGGIPTLVRAPDLDRKSRIYDIWLPTAGLSYSFDDSVEVYISYGKNFIRPYAYMPLLSLYNRLRPNFQAAGITLNDLFEGYNIERSYNVDFGVRIIKDIIEITPTLFLSKHKNLLTTVSDPRVLDSGKSVNYQQNLGKAKGYGLELPMNVFLSNGLTFYLNPTYNHLTYDGDITYQGQTFSTDGKQVVDVPRWSATSGLIIKYEDFEIIPQLRYIGKRYGNVEHKEKVASYQVFDLKLSYIKEKIGTLKTLKASIELDNIFDKKYVSVINAMDNAVSGTTYYVGAPFTVKGSISFTF